MVIGLSADAVKIIPVRIGKLFWDFPSPKSCPDHSDPQERPTLERGLPSGNDQERNSARHPPLWPGVLEALDQISRSKPDRGNDALPQGVRGTYRRERPRPPDRRNPHPPCTDEPLLGPLRGSRNTNRTAAGTMSFLPKYQPLATRVRLQGDARNVRCSDVSLKLVQTFHAEQSHWEL